MFTAEPDRAAAFYRDLFGWDQVSLGEEFGGYRNFPPCIPAAVAASTVAAASAMIGIWQAGAHPGMGVPGEPTTFGVDEQARAGIMDAAAMLPDEVPSHWEVYFGVADVNASSARVVALGGAVVMAAEDTPYGRLATFTDSTGALFRLLQPPA